MKNPRHFSAHPIKNAITCALIATLAIACADDKKKNGSLTRISPATRSQVLKQREDNKKAAQGADSNGGTTPATTAPGTAPDVTAPGSTPATASGPSTQPNPEPTHVETATALCRITDDEKLTAEQKNQARCEGYPVEISTDGSFEHIQLHSLENLAAAQLKAEDLIATDDTKKNFKIHFASPQTAKNEKSQSEEKKPNAPNTHALIVTYELPHAYDQLDLNKGIEISVETANNGSSYVVNRGDIEILKRESGQAAVRITDARFIKNINFVVELKYSLN